MNIDLLGKKTVFSIIQIFETGNLSLSSYASISSLKGDLGGLSYGKAQSTLNSGNLYLLICAYIRNNGLYKDELNSYLDDLLDRKSSLGSDNDFLKLLRRAGNDPRMRIVQDTFFERVFWKPAEAECDNNKLTLPLSACVVYDSIVHGSWKLVKKMVPTTMFSDTIEHEKEWIQSYIKTRKDWLKNHSNKL